MKLLLKMAQIFDAVVAELLEYKIFLYALVVLMLLVNGEVIKVLNLRVGDLIAYIASMIGLCLGCYCLGYMAKEHED